MLLLILGTEVPAPEDKDHGNARLQVGMVSLQRTQTTGLAQVID
jgi:hypothetical protein